MPGVYSVEYTVEETVGDDKKFSIRWVIPNYSDFVKEVEANHISDLRINKADYADDVDEDTKFLLKMEFLGKEKSLINIYYLAPVPMWLEYSLKKKDEGELAKKDMVVVQSNKWQFMIEILSNDIKSSDYINGGLLYLRFDFTIRQTKMDPSFYRPKVELNHHLENMLNNSIYSDVTIKSAEGVEFHSHKAVLAVRSDVLKAHFEHNTVESVTNVIETSLETEVLQEVLTYIYTDNTPKIDEIPEKLLAAAEYYQLMRLKHLCVEALFQQLSIDNAIATLEVAEIYSPTLKTMTLDFIREKGRAALITKTKGWKKLQSAVLIKTIFDYVQN